MCFTVQLSAAGCGGILANLRCDGDGTTEEAMTRQQTRHARVNTGPMTAYKPRTPRGARCVGSFTAKGRDRLLVVFDRRLVSCWVGKPPIKMFQRFSEAVNAGGDTLPRPTETMDCSAKCKNDRAGRRKQHDQRGKPTMPVVRGAQIDHAQNKRPRRLSHRRRDQTGARRRIAAKIPTGSVAVVG